LDDSDSKAKASAHGYPPVMDEAAHEQEQVPLLHRLGAHPTHTATGRENNRFMQRLLR